MGTEFYVPEKLAASCHVTPERTAWLQGLPHLVDAMLVRWSLTPGNLMEENQGHCSYVLTVTTGDGKPAVLKFAMPHMEGKHEIAALGFWNGDPSVFVLDADEKADVMLLERCYPGTPLNILPEHEQDVIIAGLLRKLWREPPEPHPFRPLAEMTSAWVSETKAKITNWDDPGLVQAGLTLYDELPRTAPTEMLLATDLHAGNVLQAERRPWLVIDPKPFVGDPAYDATQHLFNCMGRLRTDPDGTIRRFSDLLGVDHERVRLWTFARAAAEWIDDESAGERLAIARALAP